MKKDRTRRPAKAAGPVISNKQSRSSADIEDRAPQMLNHEQKRIAQWLKKVRFRRQMFGGVSEQDVWKKIDELNRMYEAALSAERARYDALLEAKPRSSAPENINGERVGDEQN